MTDILNRMELKKDDMILLEYYPKNRFEKYFDFSNYRVVEIHKGNFPKFLSKSETYENVYTKGKMTYQNMFLSNNNPYFESMLNSEIFNNLKPGQSVVMVVLNSVAFYSPDNIALIANNEKAYKKEPLLFLIFSYIKNKTFYELMQNLAITRFEQKGNWTLIKFTKFNNITPN